ncbi:hypothetical protein [Nitrosomonas sp. Nm34]|uniref:hypothetical protein n=1 Tax=Nitrosomonas sp. Nm34 TaxID=1881055 RepID=UPI0008E40996|nr:hypothetical protein [Nitrosomonas sp. Nm34]SFI50863.1 hypothetical protein SAMN05428978_101410 [Nitrosomonas sp. Nm34]
MTDLTIVLTLAAALSIYKTIKDHREREKNFQNIESECKKIGFLADNIINNLNQTPINNKSDIDWLYLVNAFENQSFSKSRISFSKSGYTQLEIHEKKVSKRIYETNIIEEPTQDYLLLMPT